MDNNSINYSRGLIKGKIAEAIFEEMFRASGNYTIIPLGYEHTTPVIAQYQHLVHVQKVLENIRNAPDFALISEDKTSVFLVEVKYRSQFDKEDILKIAQNIHESWDMCFLFIASRDNFYYGSVREIVNKEGQIDVLPEIRIPKEIQEKYLSLLKEFIK